MDLLKKNKRRDSRREAILSVATAIMREEGIENLALRKIAQRLEVTPTAIYFYYKDKNSLLRHLCDEGLRKLSSRQAALSQIENPERRLFEHGLAYLRFAKAYPDYFWILFVDPPYGKLDQDTMIRKGAIEEDSYAMAFAICGKLLQKPGYRKGLKIPEVVHAFWAMSHGIVCLEMSLGKEPWFKFSEMEKQYRLSFSFFLAGLRQGAKRKRRRDSDV